MFRNLQYCMRNFHHFISLLLLPTLYSKVPEITADLRCIRSIRRHGLSAVHAVTPSSNKYLRMADKLRRLLRGAGSPKNLTKWSGKHKNGRRNL